MSNIDDDFRNYVDEALPTMVDVRAGVHEILAEQIGAVSCNPAIGGLAKGHLVRELDALGGQMGLATDACGIQFRTLNLSKGPAVRGSRAQIDMDRYRIYMRNLLLNTENLSVTQEIAEEIITQDGVVTGVITELKNHYHSKQFNLVSWFIFFFSSGLSF